MKYMYSLIVVCVDKNKIKLGQTNFLLAKVYIRHMITNAWEKLFIKGLSTVIVTNCNNIEIMFIFFNDYPKILDL